MKNFIWDINDAVKPLALMEAASFTKEETADIKDGTIALTLPPIGAALITMYL